MYIYIYISILFKRGNKLSRCGKNRHYLGEVTENLNGSGDDRNRTLAAPFSYFMESFFFWVKSMDDYIILI